MRVAFFGGTFDPPHRGHLAVAQAAAERFALNQVLLAPVGVQPLRPDPPRASYDDRLAMTRLLCQEDARLRASELDRPLPSGAPNFTVESLRRLKEGLPEGAAVFAIAGADAFLGLRSWKDPEGLLSLAEWIVVSRPGFTLADLSKLALTERERARVHVLDGLDVPISATDVRQRLRDGEPCAEWLVPAVSHYISQHHLYSDERSR